MPNSAFTRIRKRITPMQKHGSLELGYYNPAVTSNGNFVRWHENRINVQSYFFQSNAYDRAQITMDNLHEGPPYRTGGAFRTLKLVYGVPYGRFGVGTYVRGDNFERYVGGFGPPTNNQYLTQSGMFDLPVMLNENSPGFPSMEGLGDKGYSKTKPRLEQASAFVFAREGGDLPRMLKTTARGFSDVWESMQSIAGTRRGNRNFQGIIKPMAPKNIANQFLNQQFGWKPFLSDLQKLDRVINESAAMIEKISDRNGKWSRKRVTLEDYTKETVIGAGNGQSLSPIMSTGYFSGTPHWEVREIQKTHTYAVGKYYFYNPHFDRSLENNLDMWRHTMRAVTLLGARPSPSNVYKSIPWTWAIDWITNVGLWVENYSDFLVDSVACEYLYVMKSETRTRRYIQYLPFHSGVLTLSFDRVTDTKQRQVGAGPYGFSLSWNDLTPRQLAIAGALGITRGSKPVGST